MCSLQNIRACHIAKYVRRSDDKLYSQKYVWYGYDSGDISSDIFSVDGEENPTEVSPFTNSSSSL